MNKTTIGCLVSVLAVALFGSLAFNMMLSIALVGDAAAMAGEREPLMEKIVEGAKAASTAKIVQIDLDGVISSMGQEGFLSAALPSVDGIKRSLEQAVGDAAVKAIVLRINSPGGEDSF
jgi:protease IV